MTPLELAMAAAILFAFSGIPGLLFRMTIITCRRIAYSINAVATVAGLGAAVGMLRGDNVETLQSLWNSPVGAFVFKLDNLSAFFLIPLMIVSFCISLYTCGHHEPHHHRTRSELLLTFYFGLAVASVTLLLLAANGITFLFFWEAMTISSFIAICHEHALKEVREAGLQYLVAGHLAILLLFILFALLPEMQPKLFPTAGTLDPATPSSSLIMLIALLAFGIKAGIMPLHAWLPATHANAPSHISAFLSGVLIKVGIYGLLRTISFFSPPPLSWGILFLLLGMLSAVTGVLFAIGQHDIKRLLAYHSIENIGIIVMGIGIALIGLSNGTYILFVLGMSGALLHVFNHAVFKSLLFLGSGMIVHLTGTRSIDLMGGISRLLPITSATFLVGTAAICGLPPLNGFVSEFLIYLGIFKGFTGSSSHAAIILGMAAPALAMTGGLAVACFVKVYGTIFLGLPRSKFLPNPEHPAMSTAMIILAAFCVLTGVLPFLFIKMVEPVLGSFFAGKNVLLPSISSTAHLYELSAASAFLILAIILIWAFFLNRLKLGPITSATTWDCGYIAPTASMQYTASSFSGILKYVFKPLLHSTREEPVIASLFPGKSRFASHLYELVLDRAILPFFKAIDLRLAFIRRLQSGKLNHYILYLLVAITVLLTLSFYMRIN